MKLLFAAMICCFLLSSNAFAEAKFQCDAGDPKTECAFTVFDGHGVIGFVLQRHETHGLNDNTIGQKYCVIVAAKGTARNDWPNC